MVDSHRTPCSRCPGYRLGQYLRGTNTEPVFNQVMYASSAFIACDSGSIFSPWFGSSMHQ
ncbi:hypothetical protein PYH37_000534 [Sinorhizobium numidicum]|uniref:Uncharacterized protein n=1 Tax=Sinorhizobium numidicum TaxID=680248 RepID=A0ABY8CTC7_9HYPH|nr:hypothetical protein [Sinorhizobium numidicum]WEX75169.1 hypothetical protein PYH37_000534 [Sinorhizobium numidicum]WEX81162.1 hypothetical protein PYH38_000536 [Sinorhizobium numidicum]